MIKRLSAAVLYALMGFAGAAGGPMTPLDTSDDDVVECHAGHGSSSTGRASRLLGRVSSACGEPIEDAWIARSHDGTTVVVTLQTDGPHTATVHLAAHPPIQPHAPLAAALVTRALRLAHERGVLKLTLIAGQIDADAIQALASGCGFQFTRQRQIDFAQTAEFYADLYWTGQQRDEHETHVTA